MESGIIDLLTQEPDAPAGLGELTWPAAERFPLNRVSGSYQVEDVVSHLDLLRSREPLLVVGYSSLDQLLDLVCTVGEADDAQLRLLFGHEPFPSRREVYTVSDGDLVREAEQYWLERGISLLYSAKVVRAIDLLQAGRVQARYMAGSTRLHAKIYIGDEAATVGSSNFTEPGMRSQFEANARFTRARDSRRYNELRQIAENYWTLGRSYQDELIALLEKLLRVVSWQEALARASAELLEGEWAERYLREDYFEGAGALWPSQKQGIARALMVLSNQGSVLIADATGAGKTRMGVYLIGALLDDIVRKGRLRRGRAVMICPPVVQDSWRDESIEADIPLAVHSHGMLSHTRSSQHDQVLKSLRRAQLLCVDEGRNFLNTAANRTQHLLRNMADHVVILTATPINKAVTDLVRIADLLGADNLSPEIVDAFGQMLGQQDLKRTLTEDEYDKLRTEIRKFTVRRTKKDLNALIDREPEKYQDRTGELCRFPKHRPKVYVLNEPARDREIAGQIRQLASELVGVTHFVRPLELPEVLARQGWTEQRYLQARLNSAGKLARYMVMRALRSSRAALLEHLQGTDAAREQFELSGFKKGAATGNVIRQIEKLVGKIPENRMSIELPAWLADPAEHARTCQEDLARYQRIALLAGKLSNAREQAKIELLYELLNKHDLLLAFDSIPITLAWFRKLLSAYRDCQVIATWGGEDSQRSRIMTVFAPGSGEQRVIGLCSDSLSEGVNLQQASALVHLDMPSVVRYAEQRAGRVDRMDSPHASIELWWPDDASEFALSSDERFIERYEAVDQLLGSNLPLPEHLQRVDANIVRPQDIIEAAEQSDQSWDGIDDAFQPVRDLVQGDKALVSTQVYEHYRTTTERVLSRVSLVKARSPWAFFCLSTGGFGAPRWLFVPGHHSEPITEMEKVAEALREHLGNEVVDLPPDQKSTRELHRFVKGLAVMERKLLARKKQRALEEMEILVERMLADASKAQQQERVDFLFKLQHMLKAPDFDQQPDWDEVAARWLDVIRPVWFEQLTARTKRKPLLLKDIRTVLLKRRGWLVEQLEVHFRHFPCLSKPEERIKACIIGIC